MLFNLFGKNTIIVDDEPEDHLAQAFQKLRPFLRLVPAYHNVGDFGSSVFYPVNEFCNNDKTTPYLSAGWVEDDTDHDFDEKQFHSSPSIFSAFRAVSSHPQILRINPVVNLSGKPLFIFPIDRLRSIRLESIK